VSEEGAVDGSISVGSLLKEGTRRAVRHWRLAFVAIFVLALLQLLLILCVDAAVHREDPWLTFANGPTSYFVAQDFLALAQSVVVLLVGAGALYVFYRNEVWPAKPPSWQRFVLFGGRAAIIWFAGTAPQFLVELAFALIWTRWGSADGDLILAALIYFFARSTDLLLLCYLHARMVLLLPSALYSDHPESIGVCWRATGSALWPLFVVSFVVLFGALSLEYIAVNLTPRSIFVPLSLWLQDNFDTGTYVQTLFPRAAIHAVTAIVGGIFTGGVSIAVYRKLIAIDRLRASVFD